METHSPGRGGVAKSDTPRRHCRRPSGNSAPCRKTGTGGRIRGTLSGIRNLNSAAARALLRARHPGTGARNCRRSNRGEGPCTQRPESVFRPHPAAPAPGRHPPAGVTGTAQESTQRYLLQPLRQAHSRPIQAHRGTHRAQTGQRHSQQQRGRTEALISCSTCIAGSTTAAHRAGHRLPSR